MTLICPTGTRKMLLRATVDEFNAPPGWQFYGETGNRFIVCDETIDGRRYVHFRVGRTHRLAVVRNK